MNQAIQAVIEELEDRVRKCNELIERLREIDELFAPKPPASPESPQAAKAAPDKHPGPKTAKKPVSARTAGKSGGGNGSKPAPTGPSGRLPTAKLALADLDQAGRACAVAEIASRIRIDSKLVGAALAKAARRGLCVRTAPSVYASVPVAASGGPPKNAGIAAKRAHKLEKRGTMWQCGECFEQRERATDFEGVPCQ